MSDKPDLGVTGVGDRVLLGRLEQPAAETTTRLAVVGDPHVATRSEGTARVLHRTEQRLRAVIDDVNQRDVDLVAFPGDLTKDGEPWNVDRVDGLLEGLDPPFLATPGNHDLQKRQYDHSCLSASTFAERYASGSYPIHSEVGGVDLFVVNTAAGPNGPYTDTHRGRLSNQQLTWLDDRLSDVSTPIVVCHHNPIPLVGYPLRDTDPWRVFTIREHDRVQSLLERHDVGLVICGHHHVPSLGKRNGVRQLIAPAVSAYPQGYCMLEIDSTGTNVWLVSHADEASRSEAYELAATGPAIIQALLGLTETTLDDAPILSEPPRVDGEPLLE